ncbi:choline dehydrogenase [Pseudaestuariivita atlantica]|uniref:Choline dehydrogenase n=1 Tax=Pseudaestuariivita atlantica TaxID=1317121 RepID=A0A0L1JP90_9RHOB|nr:choline dehydrogenase [Pseudaestuariivita atlantica]KNG93579.1 choline dehydrogenase [Pseudaestuariivita atlantica]
MSAYDVVIVGAGSAGSVLANRLSEDPTRSVLVLEAGPVDRDLMIHIPAGVHSVWHKPGLNWNDTSEAQEALGGRGVFQPRGRVLGGSSSINSMVYMRGHPRDYDEWAQAGLTGWSYDRCLPYFRAGEARAEGGDAWRGADGPLGVCRSSYDNPLYDAFLEAGAQAGQGRSDDLNGYQPEGVARFDATKRHGRRCSAAVAHLRPALRRPNLTLKTGAQVDRVEIENGRAVAVRFHHRGRAERVEAGEVILSGGAFNSPQLLMLSGVGPADHLAEHGIDVVADLPGVGGNLMDHATVVVQFECRKHFPIHRIDQPLPKLRAGARWVFFRDGVAASNIWEAGGIVRGNDRVARGNLQYHFAPVGFAYEGDRLSVSQAFAVHIDLLRPESRGEVRLASADPRARPALRFNYLDQAEDLRQLVEGVRALRALVSQPAFHGLAGAEIAPGAGATTDADIAAWVRRALETDFHPCGTCAMGDVVDDEMRVRGVAGLRVVDASVMPRIVGGNLNAPVQMIAARAADMIRGRAQLPPERPPFAFDSDTKVAS